MSRSRSRSPLRRSSSDHDRRDRADRRSSRIDQKSDRMVYLSNLPWELKWMELKDIIREKAGEVNFVEVLEDRDGRSKGCAVVEFKHREGADKCIENMHRTELRDRMIVAKEIRDPIAFFRKVREDTGIDFLGGGDRLERSRPVVDRNSSGAVTINENETFGLSPNFLRQLGVGTPLCNRIFITNIPYNVGVGRLYDICALAGKVTWFDLQMDKDGKSKGMAVCEYSHPIEAVQAVSMLNNQRLLDRTMAIRMDRYPKDSDRHREPNGLPFGLRGVGMGLGANGAPLTDVASVISTIAPTTTQIGMNGGTTASPFAAAASQPQSQQSSWVPQQSPIIIQPTPMVQTSQTNFAQTTQEQSHGSGHFQSAPSQTSYQSHATGGFFNAPTVQPPNVPRPTPGVPQFGGGGGQYQAKSAQNYVPQQATAPQTATVKYEIQTPKYDFGSVGGYGSSANQSSGSLGGSLSGSGSYDTSRVILIKNLPVDYTWQIVSDRVQQFGDLESVEMITPGVAKVRFVQLKDAERAKNNLQGTTVEGRAIGIEYL